MKPNAPSRAGGQKNNSLSAMGLRREVAHLFRCLDGTAADLAQLAEAQAARPGPLAEGIRQAKHRLGGKFTWTGQIHWEAQQLLHGLTSIDKQSRVSGSSIAAALADPRWPPTGDVAK
jgi:hypothetical protein